MSLLVPSSIRRLFKRSSSNQTFQKTHTRMQWLPALALLALFGVYGTTQQVVRQEDVPSTPPVTNPASIARAFWLGSTPIAVIRPSGCHAALKTNRSGQSGVWRPSAML